MLNLQVPFFSQAAACKGNASHLLIKIKAKVVVLSLDICDKVLKLENIVVNYRIKKSRNHDNKLGKPLAKGINCKAEE